MDGNVKYDSLKDAAEALVTKAKNLSEPIDNYMNQSQKIGETGSEAWGGSAAEQIVPVLTRIKEDIVVLQSACEEFSKNVSISLQTYQQADAANQNKVNEVIE